MRLLLLGGSMFLGPAIIDAAQAGGHDVTTFTRGRTPIPREGVTSLIGDRDGDLRALESSSWDAVIDTSGYDPRLVQASAELLSARVGRYVFVSTISVYAADGSPLDEDAPVARADPDGYGERKAVCEEAVRATFGDRCAIARPGLIVGPGDPTGRFTYWAHRIGRGGDVVAFDRPDRPLQVVDVRDLAAWLVRACEQELTGTFNVTGPAEPLTWAELFAAAIALTGSDARAVYVPEETLRQHEVGEWMELPLWIDSRSLDVDVSNAIVIDRALAAGLRFRPLTETIAGALTAPLVDGVGLTPEREQAILTGYRR